MPNPYRHRVNYCLQEAGRALQGSSPSRAQQETALFFLWRAWHTYLRELAYLLTVPDAAFASADALAQQLAASGRCAESLQELQALETDGWLASLQRQWQACIHPQDSTPRDALIAATPAAAETPLPELLAAFLALLERQRLVGEEW